MYTTEIVARNVNDAFRDMVEVFNDRDNVVVKGSRNGTVRKLRGPCVITYERPEERVLFNAARDANPFFHVYEALWMLGGRNDLASLQHYVSNFDQYSDDGKTLNGAYGYRWRHAFTYESDREYNERFDISQVDQLAIIADHLRNDPNSRRAVLQMWNVEDDLLKVDQSRDCCCNLSALFSIRREDARTYIGHGDYRADGPGGEEYEDYLDMTVFNRSNDAILGALGANAVHFSFLQEYLAAQLGVSVGVYHQISNDMHVYEERFKPDVWLADQAMSMYHKGTCNRVPLVENKDRFDVELSRFLDSYGTDTRLMEEPFLVQVAAPMVDSFNLYKMERLHDALDVCRLITADDWRLACQQWLQRRLDKRKQKANG